MERPDLKMERADLLSRLEDQAERKDAERTEAELQEPREAQGREDQRREVHPERVHQEREEAANAEGCGAAPAGGYGEEYNAHRNRLLFEDFHEESEFSTALHEAAERGQTVQSLQKSYEDADVDVHAHDGSTPEGGHAAVAELGERGEVREQHGEDGRSSHGDVLGERAGERGGMGGAGRGGGGGTGALDDKQRSKLISHCSTVTALLRLTTHVSTFGPSHTHLALWKLRELLKNGNESLGDEGGQFVGAVLERTGALAPAGGFNSHNMGGTLCLAMQLGVVPSKAARGAIARRVAVLARTCTRKQSASFSEVLARWAVSRPEREQRGEGTAHVTRPHCNPLARPARTLSPSPPGQLPPPGPGSLVDNAASLSELIRLRAHVGAFPPELTHLALAKLHTLLRGGKLGAKGKKFITAVLQRTGDLARVCYFNAHEMRTTLDLASTLGVAPSQGAMAAIVGRVAQLAPACSADQAAVFSRVLARWKVPRPDLQRVLQQRARATVEGADGADGNRAGEREGVGELPENDGGRSHGGVLAGTV
ncbi:hypothetical protein T484DRAFT_1886887, partial [Baffinella frigidus]